MAPGLKVQLLLAICIAAVLWSLNAAWFLPLLRRDFAEPSHLSDPRLSGDDSSRNMAAGWRSLGAAPATGSHAISKLIHQNYMAGPDALEREVMKPRSRECRRHDPVGIVEAACTICIDCTD